VFKLRVTSQNAKKEEGKSRDRLKEYGRCEPGSGTELAIHLAFN
jgi:hypothetical protein